MKKFTQNTRGYGQLPVCVAFKEFFDSYYVERDYEKTLSFLEEDFYSLGFGGEEVATSKLEFAELLRAELDAIPDSVEYKISSISGKEIAEDVWNILAGIEVYLPKNDKDTFIYTTRFTGCFKLTKEGLIVASMHMSEPSRITEEREFLPSKYASSNTSIDKAKTEGIVFDIMCKAMPGGIVSGYAEEGFPLYFVNDRYLELLGYSSYEEYFEAADGLGISHIHPDDREMVNKETMHSYSTDTQYGVEYRIRHKDGHYINVYDIGKKMVTPDNKEVIICVLYDMTEDAKLREILMQESRYDALTKIYNRRGGTRTIQKALEIIEAYTFAFFDIDNLKLLNDAYNHAVGDHALEYFAELLMDQFDDKTVLSRLGGDEFVAFYRGKLDKKYVENKLIQLEQAYCSFIEENYPESHSSVSIGCVIGTKKRTFEELCREADELMYDIKKNGKKGHKIVELD